MPDASASVLSTIDARLLPQQLRARALRDPNSVLREGEYAAPLRMPRDPNSVVREGEYRVPPATIGVRG